MKTTKQPTPNPSREGNCNQRASANQAPLPGGAGGGFLRAVTILLCVLALLPLAVRAASNELSSALQTGLFEEEANRNLPAAIESYEKVAKQFDQNRALAATAIFRLGEVNRKLGKTNEAAAFYQRILREFTDQDTLAKLSQQNLAGMGAPGTREPANPATNVQPTNDALLLQRLKGLSRDELRQVIPTILPDSSLTRLIDREAETEAEWARLTLSYSPDHPDVKAKEASLKSLRDKIDERISALMKALEIRASLVSMTNAPSASSPAITAVLDEEETEIRRIQAMIQNSPDLINASKSTPGGSTPLITAAAKGQLRVVTFLLDHGADISLKSNGQTALHVAAAAGHKAMVELLLSRNAAVDARDNADWTPLYDVAQRGYRAVAEALLAHKADVNARASDGRTPLHRASDPGDPAMITLLLANGADINAADAKGKTPLITAAMNRRNAKAIEALIAAKARLDAADDGGRTALSYAAELGQAENVKLLLAAKADPNAGKVNLPLHCAIKSTSAGIVEALLKAGADANRVCKVTWAVQVFGGSTYGNPEIAPLALAAAEPRLDVIKPLLAAKADPNSKRVDGVPIIFSALNDAELMKAFLDAGAKPNVDDGSGNHRTPLSNASDPKVISLLLGAGADPEVNLPLINAANAGSLPVAEALLKGGANPNAVTAWNGKTALHYATENKNSEMVNLLLKYKADVNARNNQGLTPLDYAKGVDQVTGLPIGFSPVAPPVPVMPGRLRSSSTPSAEPAAVAELLRQHGGLADLPKLDRIEVRRPASGFSKVVFTKSTNEWNSFTLMDAVLNLFSYEVPRPGSPGNTFEQRVAEIMRRQQGTHLPFPDLRRIVVVRSNSKPGQPAQRIPVNLCNATGAVDCTKDIPLLFGDLVEIPEREHTLTEATTGLTSEEAKQIAECRKGVVQLVVRSTSVRLTLWPVAGESTIGSVLATTEARNALFSSSDLTRVKVTRRESGNAKPKVWVVDCSVPDAPDLWLRDGDVIEVPEK